MKQSKKWVLLVSMVLAGLLVLACGGSDDSSSGSVSGQQGSSEEQVEFDIFQYNVEIVMALEKAIDRYMELNPNIKINLTTVGGGEDYSTALRAQFQSGRAPEIFNIGGPQDVSSWREYLEDLSDQPWVPHASSGTLEGVTIDGEVYGLPFAIEGYGFMYNKRIFEAAGIDASKINSYDTLVSAVQTLDTKIQSGELRDQFPLLEAVFEFPVKETWVVGHHLVNAAMNHEFASSLDAYAAKSVQFTYGNAMKALVDIQADYTTSRNNKQSLNAVDYPTQVDGGIAIERVAMIQQGTWAYRGIAAVDQTVADNLGFLPMPVLGGKEDCIPIGVPMYWCVNAKSVDSEKVAAEEFLNWLYNSEEGKDVVVNGFHFIPPLTNYGDRELQSSLGQAVKEYADAGKTTSWVFMGFPENWGMDVLGNEVQKYLAGIQSWKDVEDNARTRWEEARQ